MSAPPPADAPLLEALLDAWDRDQRILLDLLRVLPEGAFDVRATPTSPSVGELFTHMHYVRVAFVAEDAPEALGDLVSPEHEPPPERDVTRLAAQLEQSAAAVRRAVRSRIESGRAMDQHYDHPLLLLQHMIWHEGYHQGQIKLALKLAGTPIPDATAGPGSWGVWMRKTTR